MADDRGTNGFGEYKRLLLDTNNRHERQIGELHDKIDRNHTETLKQISLVAIDVAGMKGEAKASGRTSGALAGTGAGAGLVAIWQIVKAIASNP